MSLYDRVMQEAFFDVDKRAKAARSAKMPIRIQKKCPPGFRKNRKTGKCERIRISIRPREDVSLYNRVVFRRRQVQCSSRRAW